ncbi:hypothetical protein PHYBOEH_009005 [Phytophthora boehmeriae]|uniref:Elicitin n=1 Tax=Phytophthora boehmeriae TaxID=109152 RepID=A0A8T1W028_9STRA|nr:hypothetical protein PHYBOEH_009005 [Phytophthora boehmeriae]
MAFLIRTTSFLVAVASLLLVATADATPCDGQELLSALQPLKANANYSTCQMDATAAAICASSACQALMGPLAALDLPSCELSLKGVTFHSMSLKTLNANSCTGTDPSQVDVSDATKLRTILRLLT